MTVKSLNELPGMTADNVKELESIGITSVSELTEAVNDEAKVKEIVKTLSGVGPKTVSGWKAALEGAEAVASTATEPAPVAEKAYVVKAKPELSDEDADALAKRALIS